MIKCTEIFEIKFLIEHNNDKEKQVTIIFFGGEPVLNFEIMEYTVNLLKEKYNDQKVNYSITTNGTIINEELINFFVENNFAILISLDGPDNEFNLRKYKNGRKSINKVLANIDYLKQKGIIIQLRATFVSNNPYLAETFIFFEELSLPFMIVFAYSSENKANTNLSNYDKYTLDRIESQFDILLKYYVQRLKNDTQIYNQTFFSLAENIRYRILDFIACSAGHSYYTITSNGDIFSCPHLMNDVKYKIGSIRNNAICKDNYTAIPVTDIFECNSCWARNLCKGGCMAQKISTGKKNNEALISNACELTKLYWEFYIKLYYNVMRLRPTLLPEK